MTVALRASPAPTTGRLTDRFAWLVRPLTALAVLLAAWYAAVAVWGVPELILPLPHQIAATLVTRLGSLSQHLVVTLTETLLGLAAGVLLGVAVAIAVVWSPTLDRALMPWIIFTQTIPKILLAPLFAIWFGFGITAKIIVVVLVVFFPVLITTVSGLRAVETDMLDLVRSMGASRWQVFLKVRVPTALPLFFSGLKVSATFATIGAVIGEWMGSDRGLGRVLLVSQHDYQTSLLFAALLLLSLLGLALYQAVVLAERLALPWHVLHRRAEAGPAGPGGGQAA